MTVQTARDVLRLSPKTIILPVIHGSGDFAVEVRRRLLDQPFDCLAVPLPPSFQDNVERGILDLPAATMVLQREPPSFSTEFQAEWSETEPSTEPEDQLRASYVPIDPCQPVIAALRVALGEHIPRAFIDLETDRFESYGRSLPDPYALKQVDLDRFAAAVLPVIQRPQSAQRQARILRMAACLHELEGKFEAIVFVCSVLDWPWIREAYRMLGTETPTTEAQLPEDDFVEETTIYQPDARTLLFLLGELPFVTGLYERARAELEDDRNLSIDGIKELLLASRKAYQDDLKKRARKVTPHLLRTFLKYARNLALSDRRLTPDLYTLVVAAKQIFGDTFALHLAETARGYPYQTKLDYPRITLGIDRGRLPDGEVFELVSRLPGVPIAWRNCQLQRRPDRREQERWGARWNPYTQCSWPPEDSLIEDFRTRVAARAKALLGIDLAKTEKFTTSLKDGLDIRETLRNWHTGDLYVREYPPARGKLDCVVMLFDTPADPRDYRWRTTWFAEHQNESTLAFYATDFRENIVGPGIGQAIYGGALFLFPPRHVRDIWRDGRLDFAETLEERLLAAACLHSENRHVALLSPVAPGTAWKSVAQHFHKVLVHIPLGSFSPSTIDQLRIVHVLNGHHIRSYAADFIRKA